MSAAAGFLSPASRGALLTAMLVMYLLLALAAGFASVWMWGLINRSYDGWSGVAWRCAAYFPGITLGILSMLNMLLAHTGSSGAIPLLAFFSLISLWFIISIPLCFSGRTFRASLQRQLALGCQCSWPTVRAYRQGQRLQMQQDTWKAYTMAAAYLLWAALVQ